ncbi:MAG: hypothetical protein Q9219_005002 [cf. Caloplaca sp. 3 TL-2023]
MPISTDEPNLPKGTSPTLQLVEANEAEMIQSSIMNAATWRGSLDMDAYLEREAHLRDTDLNRNGGITYWILTDSAAVPNIKGVRRILAGCETLRKRALIARPDGKVREIVSHGIGSVYCSPAYRGRGYAQRMLAELAKKLDTWQQMEGEHAEFSVLWSDIGKTVHGCTYGLPKASMLAADNIGELCKLDEASLRSAMAASAIPGTGIRVALVPDVATMQWHHAREEFLGEKLRDRFPFAKGALAKTMDGRKAWCIWTRTFGATRNDCILHILRLNIEERDAMRQHGIEAVQDEVQDNPDHNSIAAIASILEQAQLEADFWEMTSVQVWNPSTLTFQAAKKIESSAKIVDRYDESITSLRWHGKPLADGVKITWIANEKYGWC